MIINNLNCYLHLESCPIQKSLNPKSNMRWYNKSNIRYYNRDKDWQQKIVMIVIKIWSNGNSRIAVMCPPPLEGLWWITHPQLHGTISAKAQTYAFLEADYKSLWFRLCSLRWKRWYLLVLEGWSSCTMFFQIVLPATVVFILHFALLSLKYCCECSDKVSFQTKVLHGLVNLVAAQN